MIFVVDEALHELSLSALNFLDLTVNRCNLIVLGDRASHYAVFTEIISALAACSHRLGVAEEWAKVETEQGDPLCGICTRRSAL